MFKFNNTHIFTGYLKQLLASANIPTCKIYTNEFAEHLRQHGKEDPRVIESFDTLAENRKSLRVNYLKTNEVYNYYHKLRNSEVGVVKDGCGWKRSSSVFYESGKSIPGLTKNLLSPGGLYDNITHEYLGEYLRFLRDYHNVNLMSLYNCFTDKICDNLYYTDKVATFDSRDPQYKIYAIPVKLFANYTIAVESVHGIEMFCGFYNKTFEDSAKTDDLFKKTYKKLNSTIFNQPFLYNCLDVKFWGGDPDNMSDKDYRYKYITNKDTITRWDIAAREHDLKLFIKIPISCKSSIVILEGDFRNFNDALYSTAPNECLKMVDCATGSNTKHTGVMSSVLQKLYAETSCKYFYKVANTETAINELLPAVEYKAENPSAIWDGTTRQPIELAEDDYGWYYKINCCEELAYIIKNGGLMLAKVTIKDKVKDIEVRRYKLTTDLYFNDLTKIDWDTGTCEDGYQAKQWYTYNKNEQSALKKEDNNKLTAFYGHIDGTGHTIHGLYVSTGYCSGLIPMLSSDNVTTIYDLGINNSYIGCENGAAFVGAFANKLRQDGWTYQQNHGVVDFAYTKTINAGGFTPISKLQLLAFNTGESHPFADRLIEYLSGSAITPIDEIPDNIKRAQRVMRDNKHYFQIEGLWENKMQKIIYDYIMNSGPIVPNADGKLEDKRQGYHRTLGHSSKSTLFDVLGYVDKDAEKWYSSWKREAGRINGEAKVRDNIQNIDIYNGLYDI